MQLTVEGYCQNEEMRALLEAAFSELKMKGPPEYSYSRLNYLVKCDIAKAPTQRAFTLHEQRRVLWLTSMHFIGVVADYHAAVKKKNLDSLDKANDNKGLYQQFYTKRLLEMKADPAYDSYSQHDKDREIGNSWLHAEENPNADHKIEEQLDRYCASTSKSKRKARVAKKETKKIPSLDNFLLPPSTSPRLDRRNGLKRLCVYRSALKAAHNLDCRMLATPAALANASAHTSSSSGLGRSLTSTPILDDPSLKRLQARRAARAIDLDLTVDLGLTVDSSASNNCNNGNNSDSDNEDNNHDGNYSDGAASNDTCPEEPDTIVAALEAQVLDQGANTAAGRPAVVTQQNGAARYTNPIKPGQALVPAGSCTLHCIVGLLTVPLAYKVLLYRPSLTFARELVAQHPPRTKIMVNLISDAGRAASTRVGQASNDAVQRNLFGAGTPGIFTVISRILPAASSRHAFEARLSVYFDGSAHDASAVASALLAAGASLGHFRVVAPSSILSKRQERLLARLCGPAHAAAERTFSLKRTAMSPFAPACAREMYKKRLRVS
ncbi:uncharacterized protein JCM10292_003083 [Rhodotorula paludigena]|uniref:uncharacterized protein n=1 Tax=Rhodotorula paludigena TaxID=86838 RepID=UPI003173A511